MNRFEIGRGGRATSAVAASTLAAAVLLLSACSGSFSIGGGDAAYLSAAQELIEGDLADQIGLGALTADCAGTDLEAGDTFECSAEGADQGIIRFIGTVNETEDGVDLQSTNLLLVEQVSEIEAFAASLIAEQTATELGPEHFECADNTLIVSTGDVVDCLLTDPADGTVYDASVTLEDLSDLSITVNVGDPIG